jgi:hypothetical protein
MGNAQPFWVGGRIFGQTTQHCQPVKKNCVFVLILRILNEHTEGENKVAKRAVASTFEIHREENLRTMGKREQRIAHLCPSVRKVQRREEKKITPFYFSKE